MVIVVLQLGELASCTLVSPAYTFRLENKQAILTHLQLHDTTSIFRLSTLLISVRLPTTIPR